MVVKTKKHQNDSFMQQMRVLQLCRHVHAPHPDALHYSFQTKRNRMFDEIFDIFHSKLKLMFEQNP